MGQNFSWIEQIGHRLDRQRVRRQRAGNVWNEDGSNCVCKLVRGWRKTEKSFNFLLIARFDQAYPVAKRLDTLLRRWELPRRRWNDRILETERWSSEQIWVLSILVWWCMEKQDGRRRRQQKKISILYWSVKTRNSLPPSSSSQSGRNPIDPTLQDNVLIPNNFFEYIIMLDVQSVYTPSQIQD